MPPGSGSGFGVQVSGLNIGALTIRIGFWGPLDFLILRNPPPPNSIVQGLGV